MINIISVFTLIVFSLGCGSKFQAEIDDVKEAKFETPIPEPGFDYFEETPFDNIVNLKWRLENGRLYFEWDKKQGLFLYFDEGCSYCTWEMISESSVTSDQVKYYFDIAEQQPHWPKLRFKLGPTVSYTVNWNPSYEDQLQTYQVFFYGNRGLSYHHNVGSVQSFTFNHLDPSKFPWTFTVYALTKNNLQYEIDKEVFARP